MIKRLIGVITVKDGWAVQSMNFNTYLPMGRAEVIAENLDRWFLDEILILSIDRAGRGPDMDLLERVAAKNLTTPLTYGGGITSAAQARQLVKLGADRLCLETVCVRDVAAARAIRDAVGIQAVIRALPLGVNNGHVQQLDYHFGRYQDLDVASFYTPDDPLFSEVLAIDAQNEGGLASFNPAILTPLIAHGLQVIAFGGITTQDQIRTLYEMDNLSAVGVGNSLSYRELATRDLISFAKMHATRTTSHGAQTRGVLEW
tara:strand:- start:4776 stop:5552 length:777 start_codon:yes stop_codon:yes gene_type:complete